MSPQGFSRQDLIDRLHLLRDRVGRTPKEYDTYDYSDVPSHVTYCKRFGSWKDALLVKDTALDPINTRHDHETLLDRLREIVDELGRTPTSEDLRAAGGPVAETFARHFGSWSAALREIGLEPRLVGC